MESKINTEDLQKLFKKLKGLKGVADDLLSTELTKTAADIINISTDKVPVDTGKLKGSGFFGSKGKGKVEVGYSAAYAPYQEFGTGSKIDTKDAVALGFKKSTIKQLFEGGGKRRINLKPQPFFFPSVRIALKKLNDRLENKTKKHL